MDASPFLDSRIPSFHSLAVRLLVWIAIPVHETMNQGDSYGRILILDDDAANLQGIADVLRSEKHSVLEASTGLQAIETAKSCGPISLFMSDMDLPHSSGTDVALKLVALYPNLPVLFISGTPMVWWTSRDVSNFEHFAPNSVDFIEKPFSASQLLTSVRSLIGRNQIVKSNWRALAARVRKLFAAAGLHLTGSIWLPRLGRRAGENVRKWVARAAASR